MRKLFAFMGLLSLSLNQACNSPGTGTPTPEPSYSVCGNTYTQSQFENFINGNLVIVAAYSKQGSSAAGIIENLVFSMLLNGIDFNNLSGYQISFNNGTYTVSNGTATVSFTLYFNQAFGGYSAGSVIPYNLFDVSTYITNPSVSVTFHGLHAPTFSYSYGQGPLYGMISGSASLSGESLSGLDVKLSLQSNLIAFSVNSQNTYSAQPPLQQDSLTLDMTTPVAALNDVVSQFDSGGYGVSYDGTAYNSVYYGIQQNFSNTMFYMTKSSTGWFWQGTYQSVVQESGGVTFYQSGFASNQSQNTTTYYCDSARTQEVGVAADNQALNGGVFTFTDGTSFDYGLAPF